MIGTNKNELQDWIETTTFLISKFMFILNTDWMVIFLNIKRNQNSHDCYC